MLLYPLQLDRDILFDENLQLYNDARKIFTNKE